jgi:hypothetical protein
MLRQIRPAVEQPGAQHDGVALRGVGHAQARRTRPSERSPQVVFMRA